jgi:hypothetical protein
MTNELGSSQKSVLGLEIRSSVFCEPASTPHLVGMWIVSDLPNFFPLHLRNDILLHQLRSSCIQCDDASRTSRPSIATMHSSAERITII